MHSGWSSVHTLDPILLLPKRLTSPPLQKCALISVIYTLVHLLLLQDTQVLGQSKLFCTEQPDRYLLCIYTGLNSTGRVTCIWANECRVISQNEINSSLYMEINDNTYPITSIFSHYPDLVLIYILKWVSSHPYEQEIFITVLSMPDLSMHTDMFK